MGGAARQMHAKKKKKEKEAAEAAKKAEEEVKCSFLLSYLDQNMLKADKWCQEGKS